MSNDSYKMLYENLPKESPLRHVLELIEKLEEEPRFSLIAAHSFIESLISVLIKKYCVNGKKIVDDTRTYPHSARLVLLNEMKVIPDRLYKILDYLRKLRNDCVHEAFFQVTEEDINKFKEKGFSFDLHLPKDGSGKKITWLLWGIIGETWNNSAGVFSEELKHYFKA